MIWPEPVSPLSPCTFLASPKSVTRGLPLPVEQDVGGLQVAVNHAALVGVFDGLADAADQLGGVAGGSGPSARRWERLCPSTKPIEK